jgi:hypothetical protein
VFPSSVIISTPIGSPALKHGLIFEKEAEKNLFE